MTMPLDTGIPQEKVQELRYTLSIYDEDTVLTDHGANQQYLVSHDQLQAFFGSEITFRPEKNLIWMKVDGETTTYLLNFPKQKKTRAIYVNLNKRTRSFKMNFPGLLFEVTVRRGRIEALNGYTYAGRLCKGSTLYEIPLPNIGGSSICLGAVDTRIEGSVQESVERVFFESPFNSHNFHVTTENIAFDDFHRRYKGTFPWRKLNKLGKANAIL